MVVYQGQDGMHATKYIKGSCGTVSKLGNLL